MTVPNCPDCGKPLGLYYADCDTCWVNAGTYSLAEYEES